MKKFIYRMALTAFALGAFVFAGCETLLADKKEETKTEATVKFSSHAAGPAKGVIELSLYEKPVAGTVITWGTAADVDAATSYTIPADAESAEAEDGTFLVTIPPDSSYTALTLGATYHVWIDGESVSEDGIPVHFTERDLAKIGVDAAFPLTEDYTLTRDLDLSVLADEYDEIIGGWTPIGARAFNGTTLVGEPFSGTFDGKGYTIRNLALAQYDTQLIGLFGSVVGGTASGVSAPTGMSVIKDLTIELDPDDAELDLLSTSNQHVGVVAGYTEFTEFEKITIKAGVIKIKKEEGDKNLYFGGIAGNTKGSPITDCDSELNIEVTVTKGNGTLHIGGIVGLASAHTIMVTPPGLVFLGKTSGSTYKGTIEVEGNITAADTAEIYVGGLAGTSANIDTSQVTGNITAKGITVYAGGLAGKGSLIEKSSFSGAINAEGTGSKASYAGGIYATSGGNVENNSVSLTGTGISLVSVNTTNISAVGGIGGNANYTIKNCYVSGTSVSITSTNVTAYAGGIGGAITQSIDNCYTALQNITASSPSAGGAAGIGGTNKVTKCAVLSGGIRYTGSGGGAYRISSSTNTLTSNVAWDGITLNNNGTLATATDSATGKDGTSKTATGLQDQNLFFGTESGQLSWNQTIWKWDATNKRPKLAWEN